MDENKACRDKLIVKNVRLPSSLNTTEIKATLRIDYLYEIEKECHSFNAKTSKI